MSAIDERRRRRTRRRREQRIPTRQARQARGAILPLGVRGTRPVAEVARRRGACRRGACRRMATSTRDVLVFDQPRGAGRRFCNAHAVRCRPTDPVHNPWCGRRRERVAAGIIASASTVGSSAVSRLAADGAARARSAGRPAPRSGRRLAQASRRQVPPPILPAAVSGSRAAANLRWLPCRRSRAGNGPDEGRSPLPRAAHDASGPSRLEHFEQLEHLERSPLGGRPNGTQGEGIGIEISARILDDQAGRPTASLPCGRETFDAGRAAGRIGRSGRSPAGGGGARRPGR
jgi:hypothetical protein